MNQTCPNFAFTTRVNPKEDVGLGSGGPNCVGPIRLLSAPSSRKNLDGPARRPHLSSHFKAMEEEDGDGNKPQQSPTNSQQTISSDDEVDYSRKPKFYDPNLDGKDESWVETKRHGHATDAVLSCPACFTTLCLECQRHETYLTQYRAMFVLNCKVKSENVFHQQKRERPGRAKRGRETAEPAGEVGGVGDRSLKHVCCSVCSTEVGVIDEEEVYHFYNVLPSEA